MSTAEDASPRSAGSANAYTLTIPSGAIKALSQPLIIQFGDSTSGFRVCSQADDYQLKIDSQMKALIVSQEVASQGACNARVSGAALAKTSAATLIVRLPDGNWMTALMSDPVGGGVILNPDLFESRRDVQFVLNGLPLSPELLKRTDNTVRSVSLPGSPSRTELIFGSGAVTLYHFQSYEVPPGCRLESTRPTQTSIDFYAPQQWVPPIIRKVNGIAIGAPKVYDTFTLRQMLAATASQLGGLSGFSQPQILAALGNFQGISRDTSYLAAQVTTTPTPIVTATSSNGLTTGTTQSTNNVITNGTGSTVITMQCPAGTVPSVNTGAVESCTLPTLGTGTTNGTALAAGTLGSGPATQGTNTSNNGTQDTSATGATGGTTQQSGLTTTSGGVAGTIAPIPASAPIAAPTNIGVSASDILVEQVQLNSQITNLRMLLQGALSDQYLAKNSRAVATRGADNIRLFGLCSIRRASMRMQSPRCG